MMTTREKEEEGDLSPASTKDLYTPAQNLALHNSDDDDDATVLFLRDCSSWTVRIAPIRKPMRWFVVNVFWAVISTAIFIDTVVSYRHERARVVAEELYLVYNGISTAIWCLEVGLTVLERRVVRQRPLTYTDRLEVVLAIFFLWDSIQGLMAWQVHQEDVMGNIWATLISIVAYIYVATRCWRHSQKQQQQQKYDDHSNTTTTTTTMEHAANYQAMVENGETKPAVVTPIPNSSARDS
uniref:Uncharacterized protein n=1 Tax=Amphora coffeiformis TaxID=265554 RepID=A0A7S3L231_9STRA|eukprot:scaffold1555_cov173-Amphora_coffeaeformis.AAC.16